MSNVPVTVSIVIDQVIGSIGHLSNDELHVQWKCTRNNWNVRTVCSSKPNVAKSTLWTIVKKLTKLPLINHQWQAELPQIGFGRVLWRHYAGNYKRIVKIKLFRCRWGLCQCILCFSNELNEDNYFNLMLKVEDCEPGWPIADMATQRIYYWISLIKFLWVELKLIYLLTNFEAVLMILNLLFQYLKSAFEDHFCLYTISWILLLLFNQSKLNDFHLKFAIEEMIWTLMVSILDIWIVYLNFLLKKLKHLTWKPKFWP